MEYLKDPIILSILAGIMVGMIIMLRPYHKPQIVLFIFTVALFALPRAGIIISKGVITAPLPVGHMLAVIFMAEWLIFKWYGSREQTGYGYLFVLFMLIVLFGLVLGIGTGGVGTTAVLEMGFYVLSIGIFFYARDVFKKREHFLLFARLLLGISIFVSVYGILQHFLGADILINHITYNSASSLARTYIGNTDITTRRVLSSYGDPNVLAGQLLIFTGIALALVLGKSVSPRTRTAALFILILNTICLIYTGSRAGMLCLALTAVIIFGWRHKWIFALLPVLIFAFVVIAPWLLVNSLPDHLHGLISANDIRKQFPAMGWQLIQTVPFGCGLGNRIAMQLHGTTWDFAVAPSGGIWGGFNSFWLNLLSQLGIAGVLSFMLLLLVLFWYIWHQAKCITSGPVQAVIAGALAGLAGQWVIWTVNNTYMLPGGGLNFWFTMGMLVAAVRAFSNHPQSIYILPVNPQSADQYITTNAYPSGA